MTRSLSIIIPAYNEETRLPATLESVVRYTESSVWSPVEILVVNDGSRDGTSAVARRFADAHPQVRVLENPGNRGKGFAVRHGMLEARYDWRLFSDADLSAPIEELDKLWEAVERQRTTVAIGSRALNRKLIGTHQSALREHGGRLFNLFVRLVAGLNFWDTQCGFKLFEASAAQQIFSRQQFERFGFDAEVLFIAQHLGHQISEVPVRWNHVEGTKMSLFGDSLDMILDLFRIRRNQLMGKYR